MPPTVLIIDDDPAVVRFLAAALRLGGYLTVTAHTGTDGLAAAIAAPPDAVLLDVSMPGMDGLEVLARLKAGPGTAGIPVLMLTASFDPNCEPAALARGAARFLSKPISTAALLAAVQAVAPLR